MYVYLSHYSTLGIYVLLMGKVYYAVDFFLLVEFLSECCFFPLDQITQLSFLLTDATDYKLSQQYNDRGDQSKIVDNMGVIILCPWTLRVTLYDKGLFGT